MNSSISRQLVFWLAVPLTLLALGGALVHYFNSAAPELIGSDRRLRDAAAAVARRLEMRDGRLIIDAGNAALPAAGWAVRDAAQRLIAGDARLPAVVAGGTGEAGPVTGVALLDGRRVRALTTRVGTALGPVMITVAEPLRGIEPAARFNFLSTLLWDFVQLDITLVLVWVGIQLGLRPVRRLRDEIAERSPLDLRPIVESSVPREIAPLAATLNRLFGMLRTSVQSQQQFIADTAHQLRTPITGMLAQLDLLAAEPRALPVRERLLALQDSVRQLSHAANQLLSLARADPAVNVAARNTPVSLDALVSEVAARFFDRALASNIDLGVELDAAVVAADPALLDDLLANLVDNALKYTPPGGRVTLCAGRVGSKPFLAVEDNGCGIPEAERRHVRQRFYRVPNSPGHGSGLGLAIVDEIARLYGATLDIGGGTRGVGTRVVVQFPESETRLP